MKVGKIVVLLMLGAAVAVAAGVADITGDWTLMFAGKGGGRERSIRIENHDGKLAGVMLGMQPGRVLELHDLKFEKGQLSFFLKPREGDAERMVASIQLVDGLLVGTMTSPMGDVKLSGQRRPSSPTVAGAAATAGAPSRPAPAPSPTPTPLPLNTLKFAAHTATYQADGRFKTWRFTKVDIPGGDFTQGKVTLEVDLASVSEQSEVLAEHLRTADFLNVDKFGRATVVVSGATKVGEQSYEATAKVTLHGKTVDVPVRFDVVTAVPLTISGTATIRRSAFGIGAPEVADDPRSIADGVEISLHAVVAK